MSARCDLVIIARRVIAARHTPRAPPGRVLHHDPFRRRADQPSQEGAVPDVHERGAAQEHGSSRHLVSRSPSPHPPSARPRLAPLTPSPVPCAPSLTPSPAGASSRPPASIPSSNNARRPPRRRPRPPPEDPDRPHVFMDFSADGASLGTIVVEAVPGPRPRLRQGVHPPRHRRWRRPRRLHLLREHPRSQNRGRRPRRGRSRLSSVRGAGRVPGVSARNGHDDTSPTSTRASSLSPLRSSEFSVTLGPCAHVDDTFQVVGRVVRGRDALSALSATETDADCAPTRSRRRRVRNHRGGGIPRAGGEVSADLRAARATEAAARAAKERGETRAETGGEVGAGERVGAGIKRSLADGLRREDEKRVKSGTRARGGGG